jgi:hypothetical protein
MKAWSVLGSGMYYHGMQSVQLKPVGLLMRWVYTVNVVLTSRWPMSAAISIGRIPAATHKLAYVWRSEWNDCSGDSFAACVSLLARNTAGRYTAL